MLCRDEVIVPEVFCPTSVRSLCPWCRGVLVAVLLAVMPPVVEVFYSHESEVFCFMKVRSYAPRGGGLCALGVQGS